MTGLRLSEKLKAHELEREKLGDEQISRAYIAWYGMRSDKDKKTGGGGEEEIFKIARKHPEINQFVFDFLKTKLALWGELERVYRELGNIIFWAIHRRDLSFFCDLSSTLQYERQWPVDKVRLTILQLTRIRETPWLTLARLTLYLNDILHRKLDKAYVSRLCKELGVPLKAGKLGRPSRVKLKKQL